MSDEKDPPKITRKRKKVNNLRRDQNGLPMIAPKPSKDLLGRSDLPPTHDKPYLEKEKLVAQTEVLMLKGFSQINQIAATLHIAEATAKKYMEQVEYRWAVRGTGMRKVLLRGKARARLDMLQTELWQLFQNTTSEAVQLAALRRLQEIHSQHMILDGLTPTVLVQISNTDATGGGEDTYEEAAERHQRLAALGDKLAGYIDGKVVSNQ